MTLAKWIFAEHLYVKEIKTNFVKTDKERYYLYTLKKSILNICVYYSFKL